MLGQADCSGDMGSFELWDEATVVEQLRRPENNISDHVVAVFEKSSIKGRDLKSLNAHRLMSELELGYREFLEVKNFLVKVGCWPATVERKIFNDPIHGNIALHPVCVAVIDTPQFQRLRNVKQLGLGYYVYPGAAHNRFEHSLGVCHLAGQFIRTLKENQPELGIDNNDVLCLELAGLCHDLGHGPFSHIFDGKFIPKVTNRAWKHEIASRDMFEYIVDVHGLMKEGGVFKKYGLTERDMMFIKELMAGPSNKGNTRWPYEGRDELKAYLYEIVANKRNCIDVDKWDYIARDCHQLGIRNNFDHSRFIKFARVIGVDGEMQICIRDKEIVNLYNMFTTRYSLHRIAYQHKVNGALDIMVEQILNKADKHICFTGKNGSKRKISECIDDMEAYTQLTDNVLYRILDKTEWDEECSEESKQELEEAKRIIQQIFSRDLFKCIEESQPLTPSVLHEMDGENIKQAILENCRPVQVTKDDFFVQIVDFDFGMKDENPVEKLSTYSKCNQDVGRRLRHEEISRILGPFSCKEHLVRVYVRNKHDKIKTNAIKRACSLDLLGNIFKKSSDIYETVNRAGENAL